MFTTASMLRRGYFVASATQPSATQAQAVTAAYQLLRLGFVAAWEELAHLTDIELVVLLENARTVAGADRTYKVMYPGFPQEVMDADDITLVCNAIMHYYEFGEWLPTRGRSYRRGALKAIDWTQNFRELTLRHLDESALTQLWAKPVSMSAADVLHSIDLINALRGTQISELPMKNPLFGRFRQLVRANTDNRTGFDPIALMETTTIGNSENFGAALHGLRHAGFDRDRIMASALGKARNLDDVLRAALVLYTKVPNSGFSFADLKYPGIAVATMPRKIRRQVLKALALFDDPTNLNLLVRRKPLWQKVMRSIRPYSISGHDQVKFQLDIIHDNITYRSFNSQVETAVADGETQRALELLETNPGMLIRRAQHLMRLSHTDPAAMARLCDAITEIGAQSRLSTLISAYNALRNRNAELVVIRILGVGPKLLRRIPDGVTAETVAQVKTALELAIRNRLTTTTPPCGPVACGCPDPVELVRRDVSDTIRPLARGERIPLDVAADDCSIRLFMHWFGFDVDLGVIFADATLTQQLAYVDYTNLADNRLRHVVTHSGDIVYAPKPNGAAEFINIRLRSEAGRAGAATVFDTIPGVRYAIPVLISYSGLPFRLIDNYTGVMTRRGLMSGEVFEPRTVETAMRLVNDGTSAIPFVIDLKNEELIWLDTSLGVKRGRFHTGGTGAVDMVRAELESLRTRMTVGELLALWAAAHGASTTGETDTRSATEQVERLLTEC